MIALFDCDCVKPINALRRMRGIALGVEGDRIVPALTKRSLALTAL